MLHRDASANADFLLETIQQSSSHGYAYSQFAATRACQRQQLGSRFVPVASNLEVPDHHTSQSYQTAGLGFCWAVQESDIGGSTKIHASQVQTKNGHNHHRDQNPHPSGPWRRTKRYWAKFHPNANKQIGAIHFAWLENYGHSYSHEAHR